MSAAVIFSFALFRQTNTEALSIPSCDLQNNIAHILTSFPFGCVGIVLNSKLVAGICERLRGVVDKLREIGY